MKTTTTEKPCTVTKCTRGGIRIKQMCEPHYRRERKYGDPNTLKRTRTGNRLNHPLYFRYRGMHQRCYDKNSISYKNYGARGIKICDEWLGEWGFENFVNYVEKLPNANQQGYSIDRIDSNQDYRPKNVRWADRTLQNRNVRPKYTLCGVRKRKDTGKWRVIICIDYQQYMFGQYGTEEEAISVRKSVEQQLNWLD